MKKLILKTIFASYFAATTAHGMDDALSVAAPTTSPVVDAGLTEAGDVKSQILAVAAGTHALIPYAARLQASFIQLTPAAVSLLPGILESLQSAQEASVRNTAFKVQMDDAQEVLARENAQIEATTAQAMRDAEQAYAQAQSAIATATENALQGILDADTKAQSEILASAQKAESEIQATATSTARQIEEASASTGQQIEERAASTAREIETSAAATQARINEETANMQRDFNSLQADLQSMSYQANGFLSQAAFDARLQEMMDEARAEQNANRDRLLAAEEVKKQGLLEIQASATTKLLAAERVKKQELLDDAEIEKARLLEVAAAQKAESLKIAGLKTQELKDAEVEARAIALKAEQDKVAQIIEGLRTSVQAQKDAAKVAFDDRLASLGSEARLAVEEMSMLTQILNGQIAALEDANVVVTPQGSSAVTDAIKAERAEETAKLVAAGQAFKAARKEAELKAQRLADEARAVTAAITSGAMASAYTSAASDGAAATRASKLAAVSSLDTTATLDAKEKAARALAAQAFAVQKEAEITAQKAARIAELATATTSHSRMVSAVAGAFDMSEWTVQTAAIAKLHPTVQEKINAVLSDIVTSGIYTGLSRVRQMGFRAEFSTLIADPSDAKIASYRAKNLKK